MSEVPIPKLLEQLEENRLYDIQLTICANGKTLKVMNGQVIKKRDGQPLLTMEYDGYSSEGEVVERYTYTYTFFMKNKAVGRLVFDEISGSLYLHLTNGQRVRVGCSINVSGMHEGRKPFLF